MIFAYLVQSSYTNSRSKHGANFKGIDLLEKLIHYYCISAALIKKMSLKCLYKNQFLCMKFIKLEVTMEVSNDFFLIFVVILISTKSLRFQKQLRF